MADRDYYRKPNHPGDGMMAQLTPVVKWLLILNLGIYFLDTLVLKGDMPDGPIRSFGAFAIRSAVFEGKIWEFITFQFIHGFVGHVLFNCLGIFFFGPWLERWWGSRKFLIFYLLCGAAGAVFFTLLVLLGILPHNNYESGLVGASAGIYGILIGVAVIAPSLRVALLFPPIELSMRQLAVALMAISIGSIILKLGGNEGGEAGHLGGAILGFILVRYPRLLGRSGEVEIFRPTAFSHPPETKIRPRSAMEKGQDSELDRILDKISAQGFQSLTDEERATLQRVSDSQKSQ
ncbi:MAG: rhomboid family intramembrane serine protease [Luteolibacter sp.]